jgi:hypothetical protein
MTDRGTDNFRGTAFVDLKDKAQPALTDAMPLLPPLLNRPSSSRTFPAPLHTRSGSRGSRG